MSSNVGDGVAASTPPAQTAKSFSISENYRWYVVWLLFVVYVLNFVDEARADDQVFEEHGVRVYVDRPSLALIDGTKVDFVREGLNESFRFENPNVKGECGCGESFTV